MKGGKIFLAEAIGTFTLVFAGVLSITAGSPTGPAAVSLASIAFAHGLAIAVMVAALGAVSGGHFNPAVTFGFVATGRMGVGRGLLYWAAQLVGATAAALLLRATVGGPLVAMGTPDFVPNLSVLAGVVLEAVATFFLVLVFFGTAVDERAPKSVYPMAIGLTVGARGGGGGTWAAGAGRGTRRRRRRAGCWAGAQALASGVGVWGCGSVGDGNSWPRAYITFIATKQKDPGRSAAPRVSSPTPPHSHTPTHRATC